MEIGKLAAPNTKNEAVRRLAHRLVEDHAQAEKELSRIFARKSLRAEPKLAEHLENSITRLAALKGGEFDRAFKQQVIENHEKAIALFEKQAYQGEDPDLKAFAQKQLPHWREHLETARGLPISSDLEGPPADASLNQALQHPAHRLNMPR
jgi:putative membrane protein